MSAIGNIPLPINEPVRGFAPGSAERLELQTAISQMGGEVADIPVVIDGREHRGHDITFVTSPQRHQHRLAEVHQATPQLLESAISGAVAAQKDWSRWPFEARAAVFLKAADLLAGPWRARINAATLLGQGKTPHQAEIDAACELIDFLRFNVHYAERLLHEQPGSSENSWNRLDHRPLEGFVYAITPFNFTAIGGNLPTAPAILGNVSLWKPSQAATLSNWVFYQVLLEAGLPPGVVFYDVAGPLFFGAAEKALDALTVIGEGVHTVIVNLDDVPAIDATGLVALESTIISHGLPRPRNLEVARRRGGTSPRELLDLFPALEKRWSVDAGSLSGGEQQMLAMARALIQDPKVLLVDEMSMGLAPLIVATLFETVHQIATDHGAAVVLVEQHVKLALEVADEAAVLNHGAVVLRGTADELRSDPQRLERAYLGELASSG